MTEEFPKKDKADYGFPESYEEARSDGGKEEIVPEGDMYEFPEAYLVRLEEYETNGSKYCIVQGALYDWTKEDVRFSERDSMDIARSLNNGEVKSARTLVEENLEE